MIEPIGGGEKANKGSLGSRKESLRADEKKGKMDPRERGVTKVAIWGKILSNQGKERKG